MASSGILEVMPNFSSSGLQNEEAGQNSVRPRIALDSADIVIGITEWSLTAFVREQALARIYTTYPLRGLSMPGFHRGMLRAMEVNFEEVGKISSESENQLKKAKSALLTFVVTGANGSKESYSLTLDLSANEPGSESGNVYATPPDKVAISNLPAGEA
jgi:hypothetical protein